MLVTINSLNYTCEHVKTNYDNTFWGSCARLLTKLTAHTLCTYLNRLLGNSHRLRIRALAFPIEHLAPMGSGFEVPPRKRAPANLKKDTNCRALRTPIGARTSSCPAGP